VLDFSKLSEEISELLEGVFDANIDEKEEEISDVSTDRREQILSMVDVSNMNQEEYNVFMDYGIANAINIFHKSTGKVPERSTVLEVVSNALSMAIVTYNIDIAKEAKAAFRTHYGWKVRQVVTDYFREIDKSRKIRTTKMNFEAIKTFEKYEDIKMQKQSSTQLMMCIILVEFLMVYEQKK
jgi:hypothetical protein